MTPRALQFILIAGVAGHLALITAAGVGCEARTHEAPVAPAPAAENAGPSAESVGPSTSRAAAATPAQTPPAGLAARSTSAEAAPVMVASGADRWGDVLSRVRLVGASATNGFGVSVTAGEGTDFVRSSVDLARALDAAIARPHEPVLGRSDLLFFAAPMMIGPRLVADTLTDDPTLVVAVDFVFWYGYGSNDRDGAPIADEASRLVLLEEALLLLDRFECPVVVGDFPDMSPAVGIMLGPTQMPRGATLDALNDRLHAWAETRPNVVITPLAQLCDEMRADEGMRIGPWSWPAGTATRLLQPDQLHPTAEGLIAISLLVGDTLARSEYGVRIADFETDPERVLAAIKDQLLAEGRSP